jgi:thymidylate synthase ThyX
MGFEVKVLADSLSASSSSRLTTLMMTYPRIIHSEHLRHRMFSFNAASSRAIPVEKFIKQVEEDPFVPIHWGAAQKGMQAYEVLDWEAAKRCECEWLLARRGAVRTVRDMLACGLHKQIANRLLEPWMWTTVICTGTDGAWNNFFALRCHPEAEPHIQKLAYMTRDVMRASWPKILEVGDWHLPLTGFPGDEALSKDDLIKVSAGRCARVSYLTAEGTRDVSQDIALHDRLVSSKHFSPTEHQAMCGVEDSFFSNGGNFGQGWIQYRKTLQGEYQCLST